MNGISPEHIAQGVGGAEHLSQESLLALANIAQSASELAVGKSCFPTSPSGENDLSEYLEASSLVNVAAQLAINGSRLGKLAPELGAEKVEELIRNACHYGAQVC